MDDNINTSHQNTTNPQYNLRPEEQRKFNYNNPTVIITAGPTGSGKSSLLSKSLELLYKNKQIPSYKTFLIDDYVQNSQNYKKLVNNVIDKFNCKENIEAGSNCDLSNPNKELIEDFVKIYFDIREKGPCNNSDKSCKEIFNSDLKTAILNHENILIETTGKDIPLKYINKIIQLVGLTNYNFLFVYSIVDFKPILINRVKSRFKNSMINYLNDINNPAPRIVNINEEIFKQKTTKIIKTLIKLRNICLRLGRPTDPECGVINSNSNFILLIFDNNEMPSKLIYDSRTNDKFMTDTQFLTLLHSYKLDGGKFKKTARKTNNQNKIKRIKKNKKKYTNT